MKFEILFRHIRVNVKKKAKDIGCAQSKKRASNISSGVTAHR